MGPIFNKTIKISQNFGGNFEIYKRFNLSGHNGIDFTTEEGTAIFSPVDGDVFFTDYQPLGYGKYIRIRNSENEFIFGHLSFIGVEVGKKIKKGDFLGYTGNTGFSTGAHLHFGLREVENGEIKNFGNGFFGYIDPKNFFGDEKNFFGDEKNFFGDEKNFNQKNLFKNNNFSDIETEAYDFVVEEGISNGENAKNFITREGFFLMMFRFSEFIGEERALDEDFKIDFEKMDISDKPSEWAADAYLFVVSEKFSNGQNPKEFISKEEVWLMFYRFLKDYHQFEKIKIVDKFKDETKRVENLSNWSKKGYDWVLKNSISNGENPKQYIPRLEIWIMFLKIYEILETGND